MEVSCRADVSVLDSPWSVAAELIVDAHFIRVTLKLSASFLDGERIVLVVYILILLLLIDSAVTD